MSFLFYSLRPMLVFALPQPAPAAPALPLTYPPQADLAASPAYAEWLPQALAAVRAAVPHALEVQRYTLALASPAAGLGEPGTPVLLLHTPAGDYLAAFPEYDYADGQLRERHQQLGSYVPPRLLLGNPILAFFAKEIGKALLKAALKEVYSHFWPTDKDAVLKQELQKMRTDLRNIVREELQEFKIENLEDEFIDTRNWLRTTYESQMTSYRAGHRIGFEKLHDYLHQRQSIMQRVVSIIEARLTDNELRACSYLTRLRVMLYAACTSLRIVLLKEQVLLQRLLHSQGQLDYDPHALRDELAQFRPHVLAQLQDFRNKLERGRYESVTEVRHVNNQYMGTGTWTWFTGEQVYCGEAYYEWADPFTSTHPDDPFRGGPVTYKAITASGSTSHRLTPVREQAQRARTEHLGRVKDLFTTHVAEPLDAVLQQLRTAPLELASEPVRLVS